MKNIREILGTSFIHLLILYTLAVALLHTHLLYTTSLNFTLFALLLGLLGVFLPWRARKSVPHWLLYAALGIILVVRIIPYLFSPVPLGYDPGINKFAFEHPTTEEWITGVYPLPFLLVMSWLTELFGSTFVLVFLYTILSAGTGLVVYHVIKKISDKDTAIIGVLLFAISIAQYQTYWFHYYKNIVGIALLLYALLQIKQNEILNWKLIVFGGLLAGVHRPAFFIFSITYFLYVLLSITTWKTAAFRNAVLNGISIIALALLLNIDRITTFLLPGALDALTGIAQLQGSGGTFFSTKAYFLYSLIYLPLAIVGVLKRYKQHTPLLLATLVAGATVLFGLFFHNRMIIYFDVFLLLYAALGAGIVIQTKIGRIATGILLVLGAGLIVNHAMTTPALINEQEFSELQQIELEQDATILVTDKYYSPWIKGYVAGNVVAPGLFDANQHDSEAWSAFWQGENREAFLSVYEKPLYIHVGQKQTQYIFNEPCYHRVHKGVTQLYRYECDLQ